MLPRGRWKHPLQDQALLAFTALSRQQSSTGGAFEDFANSLVDLGRAFEVFVGSDLLADLLTLEMIMSAVLLEVCQRHGRTCSAVTGF